MEECTHGALSDPCRTQRSLGERAEDSGCRARKVRESLVENRVNRLVYWEKGKGSRQPRDTAVARRRVLPKNARWSTGGVIICERKKVWATAVRSGAFFICPEHALINRLGADDLHDRNIPQNTMSCNSHVSCCFSTQAAKRGVRRFPACGSSLSGAAHLSSWAPSVQVSVIRNSDGWGLSADLWSSLQTPLYICLCPMIWSH